MRYSNSAIQSILYEGAPNGPVDLDSYPPTLYDLPTGTAADGLGYGNRECGSAVAQLVLRNGGIMPPKSQLGLPGRWPDTVDPSWIVTDPQPGDAAVIPSNNGLPKGHALYVSCVVLGTPNLLTKSYNTLNRGNFQLAIWAPEGTANGVSFSLVYIRFPVEEELR